MTRIGICEDDARLRSALTRALSDEVRSLLERVGFTKVLWRRELVSAAWPVGALRGVGYTLR